MPLITDTQKLRKRAARARHAASIKTEGGQAADRQLMAFANTLEQEADALEGKPPKKKLPMETE